MPQQWVQTKADQTSIYLRTNCRAKQAFGQACVCQLPHLAKRIFNKQGNPAEENQVQQCKKIAPVVLQDMPAVKRNHHAKVNDPAPEKQRTSLPAPKRGHFQVGWHGRVNHADDIGIAVILLHQQIKQNQYAQSVKPKYKVGQPSDNVRYFSLFSQKLPDGEPKGHQHQQRSHGKSSKTSVKHNQSPACSGKADS